MRNPLDHVNTVLSLNGVRQGPSGDQYFVELCAGTAAVTLSLGDAIPPVPSMGCKRYYAEQLLELMGATRRPERAVLVEPGEWGNTLRVLLGPDRSGPARVAEILRSEAWSGSDRALFDRLRTTDPPADPIERAAVFLYLQTRTYRGKPVGPNEPTPEHPRGTGWVTHGFDAEYREAVKPGAKSRGWFNARPVLADKIERLADFPFPVDVFICPAQEVEPIPGSFVLIDPPYLDSEPYLHDFPHHEVLAAAERHARAGCTVAVCEGKPLIELGLNWTHHPLVPYRSSRSFGTAKDYVTLYVP